MGGWALVNELLPRAHTPLGAVTKGVFLLGRLRGLPRNAKRVGKAEPARLRP